MGGALGESGPELSVLFRGLQKIRLTPQKKIPGMQKKYPGMRECPNDLPRPALLAPCAYRYVLYKLRFTPRDFLVSYMPLAPADRGAKSLRSGTLRLTPTPERVE